MQHKKKARAATRATKIKNIPSISLGRHNTKVARLIETDARTGIRLTVYLDKFRRGRWAFGIAVVGGDMRHSGDFSDYQAAVVAGRKERARLAKRLSAQRRLRRRGGER